MRVYGDNDPGIFSYEQQPKKPGYILIRFYENVKPYEEENYSGFVYDEYYLEFEDREDIKDFIQNHYNELLQEAKGGPSAVEKIRADIDYIMLMGGF